MDEQEGWNLDAQTKNTRRSHENNLQFICELPAEAAAQQASGDGRDEVVVRLPGQCNVHQLRLRLCMLAQERNQLPDALGLLDPERYRLLYTKTNDLYEIYDDCQVLKTLNVPWSLDSHGIRTTRICVREKKMVYADDVSNYQQELAKLIGHDLNSTSGNRLSELSFTRRKFASPRREELKCRDRKSYAIEPWTTTTPLPKDLQEWLERKLPVTVYFKDRGFCVNTDIKISPDNLLKGLQKTVSEMDPSFDWSTLDAVLKVCGREEYLIGNSPLCNFLWIRTCLKRSQELHLMITNMKSLPEDTVRGEACPLVDNLTSLSSFHEDLALDGKEMDEVLMISLWDCERKFRVKLVGFDVPELPTKAPQNVQVEALIIFGNKILSSVCSTPKAFSDEVLWNTWLEFDILLKNIPRGSKLGFIINAYDSSTAKESKSPTNAGKVPDYQRCKGSVLYFVNLQLIDHRSVLSQGPHILHMWPFPEQEEEVFTFEADKLSTATNPDVATSMAITFLLDRYSFPVVIPHSRGIPNTLSPPSVTSPTSSNSSSPSGQSTPSPTSPSKSVDLEVKSPSSPSTSTVSHRDRLRRFREESVRYTSNLPQFLRSIDWLNPDAVQDIHWLLGHWQPHDLELPVALELLSVNFADERVRGLAVQRLELLSNEEVLRYLLQLVQTLKVEPYHDSSLARFLIQRALRSKRIGHFFFWYLRSEVAGCPFFRERMAVILEAYLLGCGQAMQSSFQQQVQVVDNLHEVASAVKKLYPDKSDLPPSAAQKLQELLQSYSFPSSFQVPFDPRVRAGQIQLDRCKIMASKKKPLWLEFSCVDPHGSASPPVGIIFKQGDDLRQDMLVIQTLNIMDSIWQERSLNLNLVPYGCISTGHNIGMIEIVRDAVTIAAVQRSQGGNKGAFKNDALFEWLKDKCPLQEIHYQAMERFVNSLAGYCVATFVLGIGDRHNDNIMITDKGNLFHIDFGHILGNTKSFLGMNRERVPFVLTPDFLFVMGRVKGRSSLYFQRFRDICIEAYLSLRSQSRLLVTLFSLMLLTGIPELSTSQDMRYLRTALQEERGEEAARQHFLQQIAICEQLGWTVQANWWFHMVAGIK
ncbi:phosphatidylinositol 4,5-bisphosphate 3-kinase catalytic subunit gamma isoform [Engraulis encrasicolus]|uniref:phosphatidylinositol 4,5-bisphosphate 3-kinase catalytic subunit gamma isoform n=1 Tax=Engraulis encrasicolus TaxID=184585 RepID=UPI002FD31101